MQSVKVNKNYYESEYQTAGVNKWKIMANNNIKQICFHTEHIRMQTSTGCAM